MFGISYIYILVILSCFILFLIDELSFILYNVSVYQVFCGSNLLIVYENLVKIPLDYSVLYTPQNILMFDPIKNNCYHVCNIHFFSFFDIGNLLGSLGGKVTYSFGITPVVENNKDLENTYLIYFDTIVNRKMLVDFEILQNRLYVNPGETTLAFFRVTNKTETYLNGFSLYVVSPHEYTPFINKVQCFCYEELMVYPEESIDLPVLFYLDPEIKNILYSSREIVIEYILIL